MIRTMESQKHRTIERYEKLGKITHITGNLTLIKNGRKMQTILNMRIPIEIFKSWDNVLLKE